MDEFIAWFWMVSYWHWLALAVGLIALEVLAPTTYFLWPGVAAGVTGAIVWVAPNTDWRLQILLFAVLSLIVVLSWNRWQKKHMPVDETPDLNSRANRYLGRRITLEAALVNGRGRARIDDGWWQVVAEDGASIDAGITVEVVDHDGATLLVRANSEVK